MRPIGQTNYKRKTLLRRRAYKIGRDRKGRPDATRPTERPPAPNEALDQISLHQ
jgi:hypothetical protein